MKTVVLRHTATVGVTPIGIMIVHETNDPVLMGKTPLSQTLLNTYNKGLSVKLYDKSSCKLKPFVVLPKDLNRFMDIGAKYFAFASMTLELFPYEGTRERIVEIAGVTYELKEIAYV